MLAFNCPTCGTTFRHEPPYFGTCVCGTDLEVPCRGFYHILGLEHGASIDVVRRAYLACVQRYATKSDLLMEIEEAFAVLSSPSRKAIYDGMNIRSVPDDIGAATSIVERLNQSIKESVKRLLKR